MARREITQYFDDLDQTPLSEDELHVVRFSLNGTDYVLDLSEKNATKFLELLEPYLKVARTAPVDQLANVNPADIRRWAQANGHPIANRGKIPFSIIEQYRAAHNLGD